MRNNFAKIEAFKDINAMHGGNNAMKRGVFNAYDGIANKCTCDLQKYGQHHPNCPLPRLRKGSEIYNSYCR